VAGPITVTRTDIVSTRLDPDSIITTGLMNDLNDNTTFNRQWIGEDYLAGAVQNHNHDGSNSAKIPDVGIQGGNLAPWLRFLGDGSDGALTYSSDTNIAPGVYRCSSLTINSGVTLGLTTRGPLIFLCTGAVDIQGAINVNSRGLPGASPSGASGTNTMYGFGAVGGSGGGGGGGGASGGAGGQSLLTSGGGGGASGNNNGGAGATPAAVVQALARLSAIVWGGAGGGSGGQDTGAGGAGGSGGGFVAIAADTISFTGSITANGGNGGNGSGGFAGGGGGGGGGVVVMSARSYPANTGTITANGGSGGADPGVNGGGGGAGGAGWTATLTRT